MEISAMTTKMKQFQAICLFLSICSLGSQRVQVSGMKIVSGWAPSGEFAAELIRKDSEPIDRISKAVAGLRYFNDLLISEHRLPVVASQELQDYALEHEDLISDMLELVTPFLELNCRVEAVGSIERLLARYIPSALGIEERRTWDRAYKAPKALINFFLHYLMELSAFCRKRMLKKLNSEIAEKAKEIALFKPDPKESTDFVPTGNGELLIVGDIGTVDRSMAERGPKIGKTTEFLKAVEVNPERDHFSMFVKVKSAGNLHRAQLLCDSKFRPIYEKLILPVERLADLGFPGKLDGEYAEMAKSPMVEHWYKLTQLCESIRTIGFLSDETLDPETSLVITRAEAVETDEYKRHLEQLASNHIDEYRPDSSNYRADLIESVGSDSTKKMVKVVRANAKKRAVAVHDALKTAYKAMKTSMGANNLKCEISETVTGTSRVAITSKDLNVSRLDILKIKIHSLRKSSMHLVWKGLNLIAKLGHMIYSYIKRLLGATFYKLADGLLRCLEGDSRYMEKSDSWKGWTITDIAMYSG